MSARILKARALSTVVTAALLSVIAYGLALAQREISERVRFPPGRTSAADRDPELGGGFEKVTIDRHSNCEAEVKK